MSNIKNNRTIHFTYIEEDNTLDTASEQYREISENIARRMTEHIDRMVYDSLDPKLPFNDAASRYSKCPNHPNNGGSGICGCTLGTLVVR
jgi:hypothetical protein